MSRYSCFNLIKRQAKALKESEGIPLAQAQERLAKQAGFRHYHELQAVARAHPQDARLVQAALGTTNLGEAVLQAPVYEELDSRLEEELSGAIAETNAYGFTITDYSAESAEYDPDTGGLMIVASLTYEGDQDPDRVYHGSTFYLEAEIRLFRAVDHWEFADEDGLVITEGKSDLDLDWEEQREAGEI